MNKLIQFEPLTPVGLAARLSWAWQRWALRAVLVYQCSEALPPSIYKGDA